MRDDAHLPSLRKRKSSPSPFCDTDDMPEIDDVALDELDRVLRPEGIRAAKATAAATTAYPSPAGAAKRPRRASVTEPGPLKTKEALGSRAPTFEGDARGSNEPLMHWKRCAKVACGDTPSNRKFNERDGDAYSLFEDNGDLQWSNGARTAARRVIVSPCRTARNEAASGSRQSRICKPGLSPRRKLLNAEKTHDGLGELPTELRYSCTLRRDVQRHAPCKNQRESRVVLDDVARSGESSTSSGRSHDPLLPSNNSDSPLMESERMHSLLGPLAVPKAEQAHPSRKDQGNGLALSRMRQGRAQEREQENAADKLSARVSSEQKRGLVDRSIFAESGTRCTINGGDGYKVHVNSKNRPEHPCAEVTLSNANSIAKEKEAPTTHPVPDMKFIGDDLLDVESIKPFRVSAVAALCTGRAKKNGVLSVGSEPTSIIDVDLPRRGEDHVRNSGHGVAEDDSRLCSRARRRKERKKSLANETLTTRGVEFDNLTREGKLDAFLHGKERDGLYENPALRPCKAPEKIVPGACCIRDDGLAPTKKSTDIPCPRAEPKRMKTRLETGTLRLAHVEILPIKVATRSTNTRTPATPPGESQMGSHRGAGDIPGTTVNVDEIVGVSEMTSEPPVDSAPAALLVRKSPRLRGQVGRTEMKPRISSVVVDLTAEEDVEDDSMTVAGRSVVDEAGAGMSLSCSTKSGETDSCLHAQGPVSVSFVKHLGLKPLSKDEEVLVDALTKGKNAKEPLATIPLARITLCRDDFKRLRGVRWLNDELINAYVALINQRNKFHMASANSKNISMDRPRTYVFNTYFHTRLVASGYDFPGVARWTRRAGVDVAEKDLILIPVNLGNNHWVLAGIDVLRQTFLYLDSMHGRDKAGVVSSLKQWIYDEVHDKHGLAAANSLGVDAWIVLCNQYLPFQRPVSSVQGDSNSKGQRSISPLRIPAQRDSGSCGVFTTMIANCLEMGIKVYFNHQDIKLIRSRMALDLYRRILPG